MSTMAHSMDTDPMVAFDSNTHLLVFNDYSISHSMICVRSHIEYDGSYAK